jgi:hypothetical protein
MRWLAAGLPITLLCDLADVEPLDSLAINSIERPSGDPIWQDAALVAQWRQAASSE